MLQIYYNLASNDTLVASLFLHTVSSPLLRILCPWLFPYPIFFRCRHCCRRPHSHQVQDLPFSSSSCPPSCGRPGIVPVSPSSQKSHCRLWCVLQQSGFHGAYNNASSVKNITKNYVVISPDWYSLKRPVRSVASKSLGSATVIWTVLVLVTGLVDLTFCLACFLWPFAVARLFGICLDISPAVRPGHVEKFPLLIAEINVDGTGEKPARW